MMHEAKALLFGGGWQDIRPGSLTVDGDTFEATLKDGEPISGLVKSVFCVLTDKGLRKIVQTRT